MIDYGKPLYDAQGREWVALRLPDGSVSVDRDKCITVYCPSTGKSKHTGAPHNFFSNAKPDEWEGVVLPELVLGGGRFYHWKGNGEPFMDTVMRLPPRRFRLVPVEVAPRVMSDEQIEMRVALRAGAIRRGDDIQAQALTDSLERKGITLVDGEHGTTWTRRAK